MVFLNFHNKLNQVGPFSSKNPAPFEIWKDKVREDQNEDNPGAQRADTVRYHCKLVAFLLGAVSKLSLCHKTVKT